MTWRNITDRIAQSAQRVFGTAVMFHPLEGAAVARRGIFNDKYERMEPDTGFLVVTEQPNLGIRGTEWPQAPKSGDVITIQDDSTGSIVTTIYTVRHFEKDGEGNGTLILDKVNGISGTVPGQFDCQQFSGNFMPNTEIDEFNPDQFTGNFE